MKSSRISKRPTACGFRCRAVTGDKRYAFNYQRSNSLEEVLNIVEYMTGEHCEVIFRQK